MLTRREAKTRNARDTRQRLPAEAECVDCHQIRACPDFARCMAFEAQQRVIAIHPAAIIHHANGAVTATTNEHFDARRTGIQRIFHQLLHHTGRPLHDLARCNLAGDSFR